MPRPHHVTPSRTGTSFTPRLSSTPQGTRSGKKIKVVKSEVGGTDIHCNGRYSLTHDCSIMGRLPSKVTTSILEFFHKFRGPLHVNQGRVIFAAWRGPLHVNEVICAVDGVFKYCVAESLTLDASDCYGCLAGHS